MKHFDPAMRAAVVVSSWVGSPPEYLLALCDSMRRHESGASYDLFLSANGPDYQVPPDARPHFTDVFRRENVGFNLGAWEHAWRSLGRYDRFLFLQDDCRVRRKHWLRDFMTVFESTPRCGLVGEHLNRAWNQPWDELEAADEKDAEKGVWLEGRRVGRARYYRELLSQWGVPEGPTARHLTTVVQFTSRAILEAAGGYRSVATYQEAIAAEIAFSRRIEALGYRLVQVGRRRHSRVGHREWVGDGFLDRLGRSLRKRFRRISTGGNASV